MRITGNTHRRSVHPEGVVQDDPAEPLDQVQGDLAPGGERVFPEGVEADAGDGGILRNNPIFLGFTGMKNPSFLGFAGMHNPSFLGYAGMQNPSFLGYTGMQNPSFWG